jgi:hypothetical protein
MERCAVITRIAPTFLRFGSFEIVKGRDEDTGREGPSAGMVDVLTTLADFAIAAYFPDIAAAAPSAPARRYKGACKGAHLVYLPACLPPPVGTCLLPIAPPRSPSPPQRTPPTTPPCPLLARVLSGGCPPHGSLGGAVAVGGVLPRGAEH